MKHDLFINVAGKRRIKQYFVNPATVPKVHIKEKPPPPKRVATPPSKPRRIRFPTRRELGEADGRYYKPEIVAALMDGKELEILGSDGTHHAVVYRKENGGCLVFAHRPDEVAVSGGVAQYCLAAKGTFGREKGMKRSRSTGGYIYDGYDRCRVCGMCSADSVLVLQYWVSWREKARTGSHHPAFTPALLPTTCWGQSYQPREWPL